MPEKKQKTFLSALKKKWQSYLKKMKKLREAPIVAVIKLDGIVGHIGPTKQGMTLESLESAIDKAFSFNRLKAVALLINCPGGSPVQTSLIYQRLRSLSEEKKIPIYSFVEDVAASGGYWLACGGDKIIADPNSLVGSIGVVFAGFGFPKLIDRLGIDRRVHTAGRSKSMLDPFLKENPDDVKRLEKLQVSIHENFIAVVRERRKDQLPAKDAHLFQGDVWTGSQAKELGLIDDFGTLQAVTKKKWGDLVVLKYVNKEKKGLRQRLGLVKQQKDPDYWINSLLSAVYSWSLWSRFR